jgi:hypothetical protein
LDDKESVQDIIRCVPLAYGRQRFDTVLAAGGHGGLIQPARIHLVFEFMAHSVIWQAAVVSYFEPLPLTAKDRDIGMHCYREVTDTSIVLLAVITRSCYMSPTEVRNEFYLNPFVSGDIDLYLRVSEM